MRYIDEDLYFMPMTTDLVSEKKTEIEMWTHNEIINTYKERKRENKTCFSLFPNVWQILFLRLFLLLRFACHIS